MVLSENDTKIFNEHMQHKVEAAEEKLVDKKNVSTVMIAFDLENFSGYLHNIKY